MTSKYSRRTALAFMSAVPALLSEETHQSRNPEASKGLDARITKASQADDYDLFLMSGDQIITEEEHLGIINGVTTAGVPFRDVATVSGLFGPPYASSDFQLEFRAFGEKIPTRRYEWRPIEVRREGRLHNILVTTETVLTSPARAGIVRIHLQNQDSRAQKVPLQLSISGGFDNVKYWGFRWPDTAANKTSVVIEAQRVTRHNLAGAVVVGCDLPNLTWQSQSEWSYQWATKIEFRPGEKRTQHIIFSLGPRSQAEDACDALLKKPLEALQRSREEFVTRCHHLLSRVPQFHASSSQLEAYYKRSLQHLLLNRWTVPEFVLNPYYSTGSIRGGCVGCYLWDYGILPELMPMYDPSAAREHIRQFLKVDIAKHYLFNPVDGKGDGPTYLVNQEKIIGCIYYYVMHSGDVQFLSEEINGKTILDWVSFHATFRDDLSQEATLVDYGEDVSHLELRHQYKYNHVLPDVNGGRYASYSRAVRLASLTGKPSDLEARLHPLKALLKTRLWDPQNKWLGFESDKGKLELRYSNIIFTLFGTGVLDKEVELGLLSHLNEREFLSDYGLHSISKLDPAYDHVDIDHGGGGSYVAFPAAIAEALYKAGYPTAADDILERTLWWAQRMPYWGDSIVADQIAYRKDTPLQCAVDASAGAQCLIFGMFGIRVEPEGHIVINPQPPSFSPNISLANVRLRNMTFDVSANGRDFQVKAGERILRSRIGAPIVLSAQKST